MSEYRVVKGNVPGNYNVERRADHASAWNTVGFGFDNISEAVQYTEQLKTKEAEQRWNPGEVVWNG